TAPPATCGPAPWTNAGPGSPAISASTRISRSTRAGATANCRSARCGPAICSAIGSCCAASTKSPPPIPTEPITGTGRGVRVPRVVSSKKVAAIRRRSQQERGTMKTSSDHILTSHVGSLPRPDDLIAANRAREAGEATDVHVFQGTLRAAVADVVRHQSELGIDVPGDGELGKSVSHRVSYGAWWNYAFRR